MKKHDFSVNFYIHEDGTLAAHGGDVRGLVIEAATFDEFRSELFELAPRLLKANHGLTDRDIENVTLRLDLRPVGTDLPPAPDRMRVLWEDDARIMACA